MDELFEEVLRARTDDRGKPGPLALGQEAIWALDQFSPGGRLHDEVISVRLRGLLDVAALERAFEAVVADHDVLRSTFTATLGQPTRVVLPPTRLELPLVDLTGTSGAAREAVARRVAEQEAQTSLDLARGPLLRARLLRFAADDHALLLHVHHIVFDGWSMGVLLRELSLRYCALTGEPQAQPSRPQVSYADFVAWQRRCLETGAFDAQLAYWRRQLDGVSGVLELPTDRPRPAVDDNAGAVVRFAIPAGLRAALQHLGAQERASLFMVLLTAWNALLFRLTRQEEVVVGTPSAGRVRVELESLIGLFVNNLVLRTRVLGNRSFRDLLRRVRTTALEAYTHQEVPFEHLIAELRPDRGPNRSPFFHVMFAFQHDPGHAALGRGLTWTYDDVHNGTAIHDLTLTAMDRGAALTCDLVYRTDIFDRETVVRIAGHYQALLEAAATDPDARVSALPLLAAEERRRLLRGRIGGLDPPPERPFPELFMEQVERAPRAGALVVGRRELCYRELDVRANRLAHHLRGFGIGPEAVVGVHIERPSAELAVALLGVLKAGGAFLPLDPTQPSERLRLMLADSRARLLVVAGEPPDELACGIPQVSLDRDRPVIDRAPAWAPESGVLPENLAYVIYTSGSTGRPKGVLVSHRNLTSFALAARRAFELQPNDRWLQLAPIGFDVLVEELFPTWLAGAAVVAPPSESSPLGITELLRVIEREAVSVCELTTAHWHELVRALAASGDNLPSSLRLMVVGGERVSPEALAAWPRFGRPLTHVYGLTETTVTSTVYKAGQGSDRGWPGSGRLPIGRAIANTSVYVLDQELEPVPVGVAGELYVGGVAVARGYLGQAGLTAERFLPDPFGSGRGQRLYRTGDLGRWLPDGNLELLGRVDDQVKVRGYRVEPREVEAALEEHERVRQAVVAAARSDERGRSRLVAYLVGEGGRVPPSQELRRFLGRRVPDHMVPSTFVAVDALPLTRHGKIDRSALPAAPSARRDVDKSYVAPSNAVERLTAAIWAEILGVSHVGIHDDFFALGGHSLLAIRLMARLTEALQVDMPLRVLFQAPTVAELVRWAERNASARAPAPTARSPHADDALGGLLEAIGRMSDEEVRHALAATRGSEESGRWPGQ